MQKTPEAVCSKSKPATRKFRGTKKFCGTCYIYIYEQTFGTIPGTYYMDHVMDQFKMVTDMMATQPPRDNQLAPTPTLRLPRLMALMDKQENVVVFWEQQYHSYQAARAYVLSINTRNETARIRMRNKHIPHDIPFNQLRTGTPTYVNSSVFGL